MQHLVDEASVDAAFEQPRYLLLKHSPVCPISESVRQVVHAFDTDHPDLPVGWIDVIDARVLSDGIAVRTGIQHESPQVLLLEQGRVVWHENHWRVTAARLEEALGAS